MTEPVVTLPKAAVQALFEVYETWWEKVGTLDPADDKFAGYSLLTHADDDLLEKACLAVEPHEAAIKAALA